MSYAGKGVKFKIDPSAPITNKQFHMLKSLIQERDWRIAPSTVSAAIKAVRRFTPSPSDPLALPNVKRQAASDAISFLLRPSTPKVAAKSATVVPAKPAQSTPVTTPSAWYSVATALQPLPLSKYAIKKANDDPHDFTFVEIVQRKNGARFLNLLVGAPGDWKRQFLSAAQQLHYTKIIAVSPTAYATAYCKHFTRCSCCDSPLSKAVSIAAAMGPVCRKKFKW